MNHMRDEHTKQIWRCAMCGESSVFESSADFASHIEHQHAEALSADEVGVITHLATSREAETLTCCVFCGWQSPPEHGLTLTESQAEIFKHMAVHHMQSLSLLSLPWSANQDSSVASSSASTSSSKSNEEDDYKKELLQDEDLTVRDGLRDGTDSDMSEEDFEELSSANLSAAVSENGYDRTKVWLAANSATPDTDTERADVDTNQQQPVEPSQPRPSRSEVLMGSHLDAWLGATDSSPPYPSESIIPYLRSLNSWYSLYDEALKSLQALARAQDAPILWLHGSPGCGKTSFFWAARELRRNHPPAETVNGFFCFHPRDGVLRTFDQALRALIWQIRDQVDFFPGLDNLYESCKMTANTYRQPTTLQLAQCFEHVVADEDMNFEIFLDALDVCPSSSELAQWLHDMTRRNFRNVRVVVTSRLPPAVNSKSDGAFQDQVPCAVRLLSDHKEISGYVHQALHSTTFPHQRLVGSDSDHYLENDILTAAHDK